VILPRITHRKRMHVGCAAEHIKISRRRSSGPRSAPGSLSSPGQRWGNRRSPCAPAPDVVEVAVDWIIFAPSITAWASLPIAILPAGWYRTAQARAGRIAAADATCCRGGRRAPPSGRGTWHRSSPWSCRGPLNEPVGFQTFDLGYTSHPVERGQVRRGHQRVPPSSSVTGSQSAAPASRSR